MRRAQLFVGMAMLFAFIASGAYMDRRLHHLRGMPDGPRMVYRACHINLLLIGAYNVMSSGRRTSSLVPPLLDHLITLLGMFAAAVAVTAFINEPTYANLYRPWTRAGVYATFAAAVLELVTRAAVFSANRTASRSTPGTPRSAP